MNKTTAIISSILISIAVCLLIFVLVNSAKPIIKIGDVLSGKIEKKEDISAIFECYFFKRESDKEFLVSELVPCINPDAPTLRVILADNMRTPELYRGAQLFIHGIYKIADNVILAYKIEASCPSKRIEMLEESKKQTQTK